MPDSGTHTEREDDPWEISIGDHPARADSPLYVKTRALMVAVCKEVGVPFYGPAPWQDHHSGILWAYNSDTKTWHIFRNMFGLEWSAQFCADPKKVELARLNALLFYKRFSETLDQFDEMGHQEQRTILATEITNTNGITLWTDSIFNASMPLPQPVHTGSIKSGSDGSKPIAGIHHYPLPIWDIQFFKQDDFCLWVTDEEGNEAAVVPVAHRGKGDARVEVVHAVRGSKLHAELMAKHDSGQPHILDADHSLAQQAYGKQK